MWQIVRTEIAYYGNRLLVWTGLVLLFALYPWLFELFGLQGGGASPSLARTAQSSLAAFFGFLLFFQVFLVNEFLDIELREGRLRMLATLPLPRRTVALARLLRVLVVPFITLTLGVVAWTLLPEPGSSLWAIFGMSGIAGVLVLTLALLHDIGGPKLKTLSTLVTGVFGALLFLVFPGAVMATLAFVGAAVETPAGTLISLLIAGALVLVNLELFSKRKSLRTG
ncbi:MAG: hypothetical protein M3511_07450 [Deinococcota bacterium]|jgi:hypothetical protein|nr:hypothetical protein [Deinococcota bacterium]